MGSDMGHFAAMLVLILAMCQCASSGPIQDALVRTEKKGFQLVNMDSILDLDTVMNVDDSTIEEYEQAEWEEEKGKDSTEVKIYATYSDKPGSNEISEENELLDVEEEEHLVDFDGDESYQYYP